MMDLFTPSGADTATLNAGTSTGSVALPTATGSGGQSVRVHNAGDGLAFIQFGGSTVEATTAKMPIPAGAVETFQVSPQATHVAAITASGTHTLYFTGGQGA